MDDAPVQFPLLGVDLSRAFVRQTGETTPSAVNVRAYDPLEDRRRGGSRDGLDRWIDEPLAGVIQCIGSVAATGEEFVIGYFPFQWPGFVTDPGNFGPVRHGGSGEPSLPGLVPLLTWVPASSSLYFDEAFGGTHLDATAADPRDSTSLSGSFSYTPPSGTVFGTFSTQRTVVATFTPTDTATFRSGQAVFDFHLRPVPTKVDWTAPSQLPKDTVLDSSILNATGNDTRNDAAVSGQLFYTLFDPDGNVIDPAEGATLSRENETYTILVKFKPTDSKKYGKSSKTVSILISADQHWYEITGFGGSGCVHLTMGFNTPNTTDFFLLVAPNNALVTRNTHWEMWESSAIDDNPGFREELAAADWTLLASGVIDVATGTFTGLPDTVSRSTPFGQLIWFFMHLTVGVGPGTPPTLDDIYSADFGNVLQIDPSLGTFPDPC